MDENYNQIAQIPFEKEGKELLICISKALLKCFEYSSKNPNCDVPLDSEDVHSCFLDFYKFERNKRIGLNNHFKFGTTSKERKNGFTPRLSNLVIQEYNQLTNSKTQGIAIPSPLSILYKALTIPNETQSSAYSLMFCRTYLFELYKVYPDKVQKPEGFTTFNTSDINDALYTFNSWSEQDNNIPSTNKPFNNFLLHYLSMKGLFYLRFGKIGNYSLQDENYRQLIVESYLNEGQLNTSSNTLKTIDFIKTQIIDNLKKKGKANSRITNEVINANSDQIYEFHKHNQYKKLPDSSELMNELSGIPIPIRGWDIVFHGGLRLDYNNSLVVRVNGKPGSGKTTFGLSLAPLLAPYGTICYYISFEENKKDLENRLFSLIPNYIKKLSIFTDIKDTWYNINRINLPFNNKLEGFTENYLMPLITKIEEIKKRSINNNLPLICPLLIIIDSIRDFLIDKNELQQFIINCKRLGALVILNSGEQIMDNEELDYLVDVVIKFNQINSDSPTDKPQRLFQLLKTRNQLSRPGSHLFHLSGEQGFRISPQIASHIDKKMDIERTRPNEKIYIDTFAKDVFAKKIFLFEGSHILIHGHGSSNKSALALKILMSPLSIVNSTKEKILPEKIRRKVLVISFLYSTEHYKKIENSLLNLQLAKKYKDFAENHGLDYKIIKPQVIIHDFFSGYLAPEDLVYKIVRMLDEAILNGEPYTGVLIDGLHNVSLQFQNLKGMDKIWPAIYNIINSYNVTQISTFTNFLLNIDTHNSTEDQKFMLEGHLPLLHTIVKATDYYFNIEQTTQEKYLGKFEISVREAIGHTLTGQKFLWDKNDLSVNELK